MQNKIYEKLHKHYGELNWWPAKTPFEVMVGAILTQNTAWTNVEKAIANFGDTLSPQYIADIDINELCGIIRPAGFFNQKAAYLKAFTEWFKLYDYSIENVKQVNLIELRKELLSVNGIGKETADSILLYALSYPVFVVDAYTKRLLERLEIKINPDYDTMREYFESAVHPNLYNNYHALIVKNAKEHCKKKPVCFGCPLLGEHCKGVL